MTLEIKYIYIIRLVAAEQAAVAGEIARVCECNRGTDVFKRSLP